MSTYNFSGTSIISGITCTNLAVTNLNVTGQTKLQGVTTTSLNTGGYSIKLGDNFTTSGTSPLYFLTSTTASVSFLAGGALASVVGSDTQILYNSSGILTASPSLTWSPTISQLLVGNTTTGIISLGDGVITKITGSLISINSDISASNSQNLGSVGTPWNFIYNNKSINNIITTSNLTVTGTSRLQSTTISSLYTNGNSIINGRFGVQTPFAIISDVGLTAATSGYVITCTYQATGSSFSVTGTGVSFPFVTSLKYNGATGTSVTIDQQCNYLLSVNGVGANQILGALYYIQSAINTGSGGNGIGIYNIGSNGLYGNVSVAVTSNGAFGSTTGSLFLRVTITATTSASAAFYGHTITLTEMGKN